ncbi:dihydrolipoyl dehydrogenase [Egicoccus halophilus]|uniref:Dihydrolipoyl dehydrogenase n=1 Tax=Egicoccus halophilus TaxID=1670830 RepID=A0A8J3EU27_9ACTN|nr:dihydrolipoyl dehydrogenase [Egicoccus halophilus]GGI06280.1 dihydrolipoyl dehydrogenase [Egicoccus halophilus]
MHDIVVVGGGPGGYATAFRAAARGLDVALVESDKVGGTCLHRGCIPSKALLHVAEVLEEVHRADIMGLKVSYEGLDGDALSGFRDGVITRMFKGLDFLVSKRTTRHAGRGRLLQGADGRVEVEVSAGDGSTTRVQGRHVVIATGSVPRGLPGVEIDGEVVQTSDHALWFTEPPARAVVIGAGAIGMEFASMWRPMGSEVTVVEALERVLPLEDTDSSAAIAKAYAARGIEVLTSARVQSVERDGDLARVEVEVDGERRVLEVDRVLVATGRGPNTADIGADELGLLDERGFVTTDEWGATKLDGVWAVGDVRPTLALAHAAFAEGFVVADRIALASGVEGDGLDAVQPVDHTHTPRVTYCHPEVASVGLTEAEAREAFGDAVATETSSFKHNAKGILAGTDGFVKVVHRTDGTPTGATGSGGPVVGVHIVGPHATDLIAEATLATTWEALPVELAAITHAHPSLYEAMGEAFQSAAGLPFHGA